jgi:ketosteroid isomerase-like protein
VPGKPEQGRSGVKAEAGSSAVPALAAGPGLGPDAFFTEASRLLRSAYAFAREAHAGQRQEADGTPYIEHAVEVGRLLYLAGCRDEVVAAGLLHDAVEDTAVSVEDIERRFGHEVALLVDAMTEPAGLHLFTTRKQALRRQIAAAGREVQVIFGADKIVSTRSLRRAIADRGEAEVRQRLTHPLDEKVEHYRSSLELLDGAAEPLPLVALLREELEQLADEQAWQERIRTINRLLEGLNRRDVPAVLELCDPDVEWMPPLPARSAGVSYGGHEGVRRYFADLAGQWSSGHVVVYRLTRHEDGALAVCGVWAKPNGGGEALSHQVVHLFGFRGSRVAVTRPYDDRSAEHPGAAR